MSKEAIEAVASALDLTLQSDFVPLSLSRHSKNKHPTLNWRVTLKQAGRYVLTADYSAGTTHCPAYRRKDRYRKDEAVAWECEHGFPARVREHQPISRVPGARAISPTLADVLHSLVMEAGALDYGSFEEWAAEFGYSPDSRDAERVYRACLGTALKLRNSIGDDGIKRLREACEDY